MYCPSRIEARLRAAEASLGFPLRRNSVSATDQFEDHLRTSGRYVYDDHGLPIGLQNLRPDEAKWIQNEQALVQCDHQYALTRYCYVKNEENVIGKFQMRTPQRIIYDVIADMEAEGIPIEIMILKARQLGMCLDPKTRVLTADLRWIPISDVVVGQELVSVDEASPKGRGNARKMRRAVTLARRDVFEPAFKLTMENGETLIATAQHRFMCKCNKMKLSTEWRPISDMRVGDEIRYITQPWGETTYEDGWFAGLLDGEGSIRKKQKAGAEAGISQVMNSVYTRALEYLKTRGYTYHIDYDRRVPGSSSKFGKQVVYKLVVNRMNELFRLVGQTRPARFIGRPWWEGKDLPGKRSGMAYSKIVSIEPLPAQHMVDLQTSTGTFIAEGFVSHNSTLVELLIMLRIVFGYGINAVIASAEVEKSALMARMLFLAYDRLPVWLRPRATARSEESDPKKLVFGTLNTVLSVQHGGKMKGGIAQGWTPTLYHMSEVALFPSPETQIDEGLFRAVHPSTSVFGVLESTGAGDEGWWPDTWHYSRANWATRSCRLRPLFLPWFCGVEIYPKSDWIRAHPVPEGFYERRLPDTRTHVAKAEAYVSARPEIMKYLGQHWVMPIEQQWFWEVGFNEAKAKGREGLWYQSMAGDDIEALQRSAESIFGHDTIQSIDERRKKDYLVYGLCGQSIEENHEPATELIDYAKPRVPVRYSSPRGDVYRWELIPLKHDERQLEVWQRTNAEAFKDYANGKLLIFHPPQPGVDYSVGIDTSNGIGQDSTVISVCAIGQRGGPDTQVAEFRSAYVSHVEAYAFAMVICAYYAQHMGDTTSHREPLIAAEQLRAVGDTCQLQMRKMGYSRIFKFSRYDKKNVSKIGATQLGWMTTGWSRPLLLGGFQHSIENGWYILNSPWTIYEMAHFEMHLTSTGRPKPEHAEGEHDDGIFAAAISTFIVHDEQSMTERTAKKFMGDPISKPKLDLGAYSGQRFSTAPQTPVDIDRLL